MIDYRSKVESLKEQIQINTDQKYKISDLERDIISLQQTVSNE
jgi:hypothetical protein